MKRLSNLYIQLQKYVDIILEFDDLLSDSIGVPALRPQARLIMLIQRYGSVSIKEAIIDSKMSSRGFYMIMDSLLKEGVICIQADQNDKRVRRLAFSEHVSQNNS